MRPPLSLIPQFFGSLVFDRRTSRYLPFDHECTRLFQRLRSDSIERIVAEHEKTKRKSLLDFYGYFYQHGFFDVNGYFAGLILQVAPAVDHLVGPLAVHLEVTASCNLACSHCFAGDLPRREHALSLDELGSLFEVLASLGSYRLGLTGGEPLLRNDLFEVIDLATEHGLHPCLATNGLLITEQVAREFGRRDLVWLNVSLDGATAKTNDAIRGGGTFDRVMQKLSILRRHARFTLAFTITSANFEEVEACAKLAHDLGAHTAIFRPLYPVGTAARHPSLMPTYDQYATALQRLAVTTNSWSGNLCSIDAFNPQSRQETQARVARNDGCGAGNLVCSVSLKGDVSPCSFLGPTHVAENLRDVPFDHIWHHSQRFRSIRGLPRSNPCATCDEHPHFRGGCRARAQAFNGSINAPDPWYQEFVTATRAVHPMSNVTLDL